MACEWHWLAFSTSFLYFQLTQTNIWMVHWRSWIGLVFVFQLSSFSSSLLGFGYKSGFLAGEVCCMCNVNLQGLQEASKQIWTCYCLMSLEVSLFVRWKVDQSVSRMDEWTNGWTDGLTDKLTDGHSHWKNFVPETINAEEMLPSSPDSSHSFFQVRCWRREKWSRDTHRAPPTCQIREAGQSQVCRDFRDVVILGVGHSLVLQRFRLRSRIWKFLWGWTKCDRNRY